MIIDKPQNHILPLYLRKKVFSQSKPLNLPDIQMGKLYYRHKSNKKMNHKLQSYVFNVEEQNYRPLIRRALAQSINFDNSSKKDTFSVDEQLKKLKEPVKPLNFSSDLAKKIIQKLRQIFGQDYQIKQRQLLILQGKITKKHFIIFNSKFRPYSLCCRSPIYLKTVNFEESDFILHESSKKDDSLEQIKTFRTNFICSKCQKISLSLVGRQKIHETSQAKNRSFKNKQELELQIQRKKISLSVQFGSGNFKMGRLAKRKGSSRSRYQNSELGGQSIDFLPQYSKKTIELKKEKTLQGQNVQI